MAEVEDGVVSELDCARLIGKSVLDCICFLENDGGFLQCPPIARKALPKMQDIRKAITGDVCRSCGGVQLVRAGTCLLCLNCGDTSGGCS